MKSAGSEKRLVCEEYARIAPSYDRRWRFYIRETTRETLSRMEPETAERILDVGCGTGVLLGELSRWSPGRLLVGVDPVPEMLTVSRERLGAASFLILGWSESLPVRDDTFDMAVVCNVFHYLDQPERSLLELGRVLRPGGRLTMTDWCGDYPGCRLLGWYLRAAGRPLHRVYRPGEWSRMLAAAGFRGTRIETYRISPLWGLMTATAISPD